MDKTELRNVYIERRRDLTLAAARQMSAAIAARFKTVVDLANVSSIHVYTSVSGWNEVDTSWLNDYVRTTYPAITLDFSNPDRSSPIPNTHYDVMIVPLLAFDTQLYRLGFGGGWYDRALAAQPQALKVGLAYDFQYADYLPHAPHDIAMNMILTESTTYT